MTLRFVEGRAASEVTITFLQWVCRQLSKEGKKALLLVWDNASWHISKMVHNWIGEPNRQVKRSGKGVRIVACYLPVKGPWLNPIEPKWVHGKRRVVEPDGLLTQSSWPNRCVLLLGVPTRSILLFPKRSPVHTLSFQTRSVLRFPLADQQPDKRQLRLRSARN